MNKQTKELRKEAEKAAQLAKIDVAVDEALLTDFTDCLAFFTAPDDLDMHTCKQQTNMRLRKDVQKPSLLIEDVLANASSHKNNYIVVPRVLPGKAEETV